MRASWGRVTDIPNASYFDNAGSSTVAQRDEYDLDLDGIFETIHSTPASHCARHESQHRSGKASGLRPGMDRRLSDAAARRP